MATQQTTVSTIYCEVCRLPHTTLATQCEACEHRLGTPPDVSAIRAKLRRHGGRVILACVVLGGVVAFNVAALEQGSGGVLIYLPVIPFFVWSVYRYRVLARWYANARASRVS
jgi:hypothetical protein